MSTNVKPTAVYIRLAEPKDVSIVCRLIKQLAKYEKMVDQCLASEESLMPHLFDHSPLQGPSALIMEITESPSPSPASDSEFSAFSPLHSPLSIHDPENSLFKSSFGSERTAVGYAIIFPNFSSFLSRPGIFIEDLYVREPFRGLGLGTKMLSHIANIAVKNGMQRVDWYVLDWNKPAIQFYENRVKAKILHDWRVCRLSGLELDNLAFL